MEANIIPVDCLICRGELAAPEVRKDERIRKKRKADKLEKDYEEKKKREEGKG